MRKPDSNFKLPKRYKVMLTSIKSKELRDLWKKSLIEATLAEEDYRRSKISVTKGE